MSTDYDPLASVQAAGPPGTISFIYGLPDPATFPAEMLRQAADHVLRDRPEIALQYGPEQGYGPLIDYLRNRLARDEGLIIGRPEIMLTRGSASTLDHMATLLAQPGDVVLVEAPTYHETLQLFRDHRLRPLQVPTDGEGMSVDGLAARLGELASHGERARFLYLIPNYQNPTGITLATERRQPILDVAAAHDLLVIEDDVYRDLAYEDAPPASLLAIERRDSPGARMAGRVLRISSFSKILAPGLRLGWLLASADQIQTLVQSGLSAMGGGANPLVANIVAEYCLQGHLEAHIERLRDIYRERRDAMLTALRTHMPDGAEWTYPGGGFFIWLRLPEPLLAPEVAARARGEGLLIPVGNPFFAEQPTGQYLRLAFSYVTPERIRKGIEKLGEVLRKS
ncbi:MAG: PLP-dependent aminotransferase family protein [Anaerolineae bacterium]|nr:PLP-dependent aminotransferase family protein [Anaerolineae bacterium]